MSKQLDTTKAADWSDTEYEENVKYLELRGDTTRLAQVRLFRGENTVDVPTHVPNDDGGQQPSMNPKPPPQQPSAPTAESGGEPDWENANVDEILDWVGDDPARAQKALDTENEYEEPRKTLVEKLEKKTKKE